MKKRVEEIKEKINRYFYEERRKNRKDKFQNRNLSIISNNCVGGIMLHNLGCEFNTPTINLSFNDIGEYLTYLQNLKEYNSCDLVENKNTKLSCPVGILKNDNHGDVTLNFWHYKTFEKAKEKWIQRRERVNYSNLYVVLHWGDKATDELIEKFSKLSYKHKIIISYPETMKKCSSVKNCDFIYSMKAIEKFTPGDLFAFSGWFGKMYLDEFDYCKFLSKPN